MECPTGKLSQRCLIWIQPAWTKSSSSISNLCRLPHSFLICSAEFDVPLFFFCSVRTLVNFRLSSCAALRPFAISECFAFRSVWSPMGAIRKRGIHARIHSLLAQHRAKFRAWTRKASVVCSSGVSVVRKDHMRPTCARKDLDRG